MKCPACKTEFKPTNSEIASELGRKTSNKKAAASRKNGKKGGARKKTP